MPEKYWLLRLRSKRSFTMRVETLFGGARVELAVSSAAPDVPADPRIAVTLHAFLETMQIANSHGETEAFQLGFQAFIDEVLEFLESRHIPQGTFPGDLIAGMEDFMRRKDEE
jgi:hypothetical protein